MNAPGYEQLSEVLRAAFDQAAYGKGAERHARGNDFDKQHMQTISTLLGTERGMAFQVCKKLTEGLDMEAYDRFERELLGVIIYTAGIIIWRKKNSPPTAEVVKPGVDISDEAAPSKPAPDPYDWYTWKPGDLLVCEQRYSEGRGEPAINVGDFVRVLKVEDRDCVDDLPVKVNHDVLGDIWPDHEDYDAKGDDKPLRRIFRFHSRPTK